MEIQLTIGGREILIHDTIVNIWFVVLVLSIFAIIVNKKIKTANVDEAPSGLLNVVEILVESINNLVKTTMGSRNMRFASYIFFL